MAIDDDGPHLQSWEPYVRQIAELMGLSHWTVRVIDRPSGDDHADVDRINGRYLAIIQFGSAFLRDTPEGQRDTVVHELLHCHLAMQDYVAWENLPDPLKPVFRKANEYAVDLMARAWSALLPLPPVAPKRKRGNR